jgi:hypothetical protein
MSPRVFGDGVIDAREAVALLADVFGATVVEERGAGRVIDSQVAALVQASLQVSAEVGACDRPPGCDRCEDRPVTWSSRIAGLSSRAPDQVCKLSQRKESIPED